MPWDFDDFVVALVTAALPWGIVVLGTHWGGEIILQHPPFFEPGETRGGGVPSGDSQGVGGWRPAVQHISS